MPIPSPQAHLHTLQIRLAALGLKRDIAAGRYNACDFGTMQNTKRLAQFLFDLSEGMAELDAVVVPITNAPPPIHLTHAGWWGEAAEYVPDTAPSEMERA